MNVNYFKTVYFFSVLSLVTFSISQIDPRPVINSGPFASPTRSEINSPITFSVSATSPNVKTLEYAWHFEDSISAYSPDSFAQHSFSKVGINNVIVFIRNGTAIRTALLQVWIHYPLSTEKPKQSNSILYISELKQIWNVNPDNNSVTVTDAETMKKIENIQVGNFPRTLDYDQEGRVWVTNQDDASLTLIDQNTRNVIQSIDLPYASRPFGIIIDQESKFAYVTLEATGELVQINISSQSMLRKIPLGLSVRGLALPGSGNWIAISRFISPKENGELYRVSLPQMTKMDNIIVRKDTTTDAEDKGRGVPNYISHISVSPDDSTIWIPSKKDNTDRGEARDGQALTFESSVRTTIAQVKISNFSEDLSLKLDVDDSDGATQVIFGPAGYPMFLAFQGTNKIQVFNPEPNGGRLLTIPNVGLAPQGMVLDSLNQRLYVHNYMSRTLSVFDVSRVINFEDNTVDSLAVIPTIENDRLSAQVLLGKKIFYNSGDPRMSKDGYISCATCHLNGGSDGRVWDFTDRGEGFRITIPLIGRGGMGHGPVHWSANFDEIQDFEHDIRGPFGGTGLMSDIKFLEGTRNQTLGDKKAGVNAELDALAAYVATLTKVNPSPFRNSDGSLTDDAQAGKIIFFREEVGCANCHSGQNFTDSDLNNNPFLLHDVGTIASTSGKRLGGTLPGFDTPTLKGVWEFPPYLHDGRAQNLMEVITTYNSNDAHGKTSQLSPIELNQLVAFLKQIDDVDSSTSVIENEFLPKNWNSKLTVNPYLTQVTMKVYGGQILRDDQIKIKVVDLNGKEIYSKGVTRTGIYFLFDWDGETPKGNVSPGVYFLSVFKADKRVLTDRVLFVKR